MITIKIIEKNTFGTKRFYVKTFKERKAVQSLTGKKTVSEADIEALQALGFNVKFK